MKYEACIERLLKGAPELTDRELREINGLYTPYLFRRKRTREVWASCCGKYGIVAADDPVMLAEHTPEPRQPGYYGCHMGMMSAPAVIAPEAARCPFCGRMAQVKELGRTGKRKNLWEFRRVIVLRQWRGALWGLGFDTTKDYTGKVGLTRMPGTHLVKVYRFTEKMAEYTERFWWGDCAWNLYQKLQTERLMAGWRFPDGFNYCSEYGTSYEIIGTDEVEKSAFRYCRFADYEQKHSDAMRFLALCTVYPRQTEMLMKAGLDDIVADFVVRGKSNARIFSWDEPNPMKSFGLTKEEMAFWMRAGQKDTELLRIWKQYKKKGMPGSMADLLVLQAELCNIFPRCAGKMMKYGIGAERMKNYLKREKGKRNLIQNAAGWWVDYIDAAETIGYDLHNDVFLLPKGLAERHDRMTAAAEQMRRDTEDKARRKKENERLRALVKKYTYTDGRWLIRPPVGAAEIIAEGRNLCHCVGGYADRHVNGNTTILFLRDRKRPGKSLVTIEVRDGRIAQIHGWKDERESCAENPKRIDPAKIYKEFLDGWMAWVAAGSRRERKPKRKKESAA
jgi:hypothetical protein